MDVETLTRLRENIDPESLRVAEIDRALKDFTLIYDPELDRTEMLASAREARKRLAPLLKAHNGDTAPELFTIGHSHIDVAWLWHLAETERKCVRTFGTQLALMEEYPEYQVPTEPAAPVLVDEGAPPGDLCANQKGHGTRTVDRGWRHVGRGGHEHIGRREPDPSIPVWQAVLPDEFGVDSHLLWLPDVFGYSGNLPQIMRGCGIQYFSTAKIFWTTTAAIPSPTTPSPGRASMARSCWSICTTTTTHETDPASLILRWNATRPERTTSPRVLLPFGWGDGGGGPTRDHLEYLARSADLEGMPLTRMAPPQAYFDDLAERGVPPARYVGELYFQCHRGTLTSQARTKRGNRKSEFALREAEVWVVGGAGAVRVRGAANGVARRVAGLCCSISSTISFPGSSIHRVYEEAEAAYAQVLTSAGGGRCAARSTRWRPAERR